MSEPPERCQSIWSKFLIVRALLAKAEFDDRMLFLMRVM